MNQKQPNPILGTFVIEEYEGKKYKMMFAEEIEQERSVESVVQMVCDILGVQEIPSSDLEKCSSLYLINTAIERENAKDQTFGPYQYYWALKDNGDVAITDVRKSYPAGDSFIYPFQHAKSRQVIRKVVEKLGVDIFRIAAGVKKD